MYESIGEEAWGLVHSLATQCTALHGFGTMSPAAYDTAWVAMVEKKDGDGKLQALFPDAYIYLEKTQSEDGSWAAETSDTDGIVNTLAALLAFKKQERRLGNVLSDVESRCLAAEASLRRMFANWDIEASDRVGLEILVPNLLRLLESEGIAFDFPCRQSLMAMNAAKVARLGPALTSPRQTTLIHTLEAFVGALDFDKVKQHKMPNGSMLASPSSTAAYLMNATEWDGEAEAYLRMVYEQQSNIGHRGGFPSAFPSTIFETSWVLDTLLESGFTQDDFLMADVRSLTNMLETNLTNGKGVVGWAPSCLADADDTAKAISALRLLGWEKETGPMLKAFESDAYFITYRGERNPSTSANCNILSCLLRASEPAKYTQQIVKCASFLAKTWMNNNGPDKWHTSVQYPMMLVAQAFVLLLKQWAKGELDSAVVPKGLIYQELPRTLLDILGRTMRSQKGDGSWESKREVTAYAVLTLAPLLSLPWVDFLKPEGTACMYRGKAYLENNRNQWRVAERVWIEKTVYGSPNLAQAYCLAALKVEVPTMAVSAKISDMFPSQVVKKIAKMSGFFAMVPPFSGAPKWKLQLSLLQSASYAAALKASRYDIFPPIEEASDEKYQEYIPFTWIGCRDYLSTQISSQTLWEMMLVSMFNFQVDAYMETVVWERYHDKLPELRALIRSLCGERPQKRKRAVDDESEAPSKKPAIGTQNGIANGTKRTSNGVAEDKQALSNGNGVVLNGEDAHTKENGAHTNGKIDFTKQTPSKDVPPAKRVDSPTSVSEKQDRSVEEVLTGFVNFALQHPKVLASPALLRKWLAHELQTFLLAHITHMEDCEALSRSADMSTGSVTWGQPRTTFFNWVRTTSADHTSCPYSFVFYLCLIGEGSRGMTMNTQERYALEDGCRHLAAMCRQYNDLGSVLRDQEEKNLNSVNFPEFNMVETNEAATVEELTQRKKRDLLAVAEYERRCLGHTLKELEPRLDANVMNKLKLLIQVTDLYGQIYVVRDIGIRRDESNGTKLKA